MPLILSLFPFALFAFFLSLVPGLGTDSYWTWSQAWVPELGVSIQLRADGLGLVFALLISGIGALITVYAGNYLKGHKSLPRFYASLFLFMSAMLGIVLSDNIFGLFFFWEITSISSYLLIGFDHEREEARKSALQALLVTGVGGLCLLAGFVLLAHVGGSSEISKLVTLSDQIRGSSLYIPLTILVLLGAFTKSAQVPFHFWLPNAMAAPTPVSAYLHSATMVKAGVFLMARLTPVLGATNFWNSTLLVFGAATLLTASWISLGQKDLKKILAYSTLAALGTLTLLLGLGTPLALQAFLAFVGAHAIYKASLFMIAGAVDHETGTRDVTRLAQLRRHMPITAFVAVLGGLAFAGLPPSWAFIAKETALEAALEILPSWQGVLSLTALILASVSFVSLSAILVWSVFFAQKPFAANDTSLAHLDQSHEAPWGLWIGPLLLGLFGIMLGFAPQTIGDSLLMSAMKGFVPTHEPLKFSLWHGVNLPLMITSLGVVFGVLTFRAGPRLLPWISGLVEKWPLSPERLYDWKLKKTPVVAGAIFSKFQNGYLRFYIGTILVFTLLFVGSSLDSSLVHKISQNHLFDFHPEEALLSIAVVIGACFVWVARNTFAALAATGIVGLAASVYFVFYGAPDLAITQILVESISIILVVLALYSFPREKISIRGPIGLISQTLAISMGLLLGVMILGVLDNKLFPSISSFFSENSYTLAHGKNIVNVILVDFRGWDTMGEIVVLALASIGVYGILRAPQKDIKKESP